MKKIATLILLLTWTGILFAQQSNLYKTESFTKIQVGNQLNIKLTQSDSCYILITNDDFNPEKFDYSIVNNTLKINTKGLKNAQLDLIIGAPNFEEVFMNGAGGLKSTQKLTGNSLYLQLSGASDADLNLEYQQLMVHLSGASDAKITGIVDSIYLHSSGASDFDAFSTTNIFASIQASGASDVKLNTDSTIIADLSGSSSLKYKKNPKYKKINSNESVWIGNDHEGIEVSEGEDTIRMNVGGGNTEIIIIDKGNDIEVNKRRITGDNFFKGNWAGLELGVNGYLTQSGSLDMPKGYEFLELKYESSRNFNINFFQQSFNLAGEHFGFVTGLGFQWYNYRFQDNTVLVSDSSTIFGYQDTSSNRSYNKSKLTANYLVVPILFEYQSNSGHNSNSFHISAGVIGGIRIGSHSKQVYTENGNGTVKPKVYDSFYLQPFRLDATARIGWGPVNIYANYSIIEMFRVNRGPKLYPFTVGLILPFT